MKKLLIRLLVLGSVSTYAADYCETVIDAGYKEFTKLAYEAIKADQQNDTEKIKNINKKVDELQVIQEKIAEYCPIE